MLGSQKARTTAQITAEETAALDARIAALEADADLEFEIPGEYTYDGSETDDLELLNKRFERMGEDEEEDVKAARAAEEYWSSRKTLQDSAPVTTVPKKEKEVSSEVEQAAHAVSIQLSLFISVLYTPNEHQYTRTLLANGDLTEPSTSLTSMEQEPLEPGKWKHRDTGDDNTDEVDDKEELEGMESWEQSMKTKFEADHENTDEVLRVWDARRADAKIKALEYESGRLLTG
jgi:hypothetical protein